MATALRIALSLLAALALVGGLTVLAIAVLVERPPPYTVEAFRVAPATRAETEAALAASGGDEAGQIDFAGGEHRGFVQLRFVVTPDGRARDVEVLAAVPPGYHEAAAIAEVTHARHAPGIDDGIAVAREVTRIVEFTYTPR